MTAETALSEGTVLHGWLLDFQERFNSNNRAKKLTKGWTRRIRLESTDTGNVHGIRIDNSVMTDVYEGEPPAPDDSLLIRMRAGEGTLVEIFSGNYNPSNALLDGVLEVYSDPRDKVKLEALAMVIWGL